jgi:hypothetical protein
MKKKVYNSSIAASQNGAGINSASLENKCPQQYNNFVSQLYHYKKIK